MATSVHALVGSDVFLQLEALTRIAAALGAEAQRIDADGDRAELADVLDELRSFALFGGTKMVVVRDAGEFITRFRTQLENYLAAPSTSATLVLRLESLPSNQRIYKLIQKAGIIEACDPPKGREVPRWVVQRAKSAHGLTVSSDAAALLADLIGNDLGRLDNELAKLALGVSADGTGRIDLKAVSGMVSFQREQDMWEMTDAMAAGNAPEALRRWRLLEQTDSSAEYRAVTWLAMWLERCREGLRLDAQGADPGTIGRQLRIFDREQQAAFVKTIRRLGTLGVARAVDLLAELDYQTKTGVGDAAANVERFLLSMGEFLSAAPARA